MPAEPSRRDRRSATSIARGQFDEALDAAAQGDVNVAARLDQLQAPAGVSDSQRRKLAERAYQRYAESALLDEHLTEDEERIFYALGEQLGVELERFLKRRRELAERLLIARVNDGRLGEATAPRLAAAVGEVVYEELPALLLTEVAVRQYRARYSGVSFKIMPGVRFHTGGGRGRSVDLGTRIEAEDTGVLSISSKRVVFLGRKTTLEMLYPKIVSLNVLRNGLVIHVSNMKDAPTFRIASGNIGAAYINAAAQGPLALEAGSVRTPVASADHRSPTPTDSARATDGPLEILGRRLATGEITVEEFKVLRSLIEG